MKLFKKISLLFGSAMVFIGTLFGGVLVSNNEQKDHSNVQSFNNAMVEQQIKPGIRKAPTEPELTPQEIQTVIDDEFKVTYSKLAYSNLGVYVNGRIVYDGDVLFSLGYYGADNTETGARYSPAMMEVQVQDADGNVLPEKYTGLLQRQAGRSDTYFLNGYNNSDTTVECAIKIPYGTTVVKDSVKILNLIYGIEFRETPTSPWDRVFFFEDTFSASSTLARKHYISSFTDFLDLKPTTISKFAGYYELNFEAYNKMTIDYYLELIQTFQPVFTTGPNGEQNVANLRNGKSFIVVSYCLTLNESKFYVDYLDNDNNLQTKEINSFQCNKTLELGNNSFCITIPSEGIQNIQEVTVFRPFLEFKVVNAESRKPIPSSSFSYRYGYMSSCIQPVKNLDGSIAVEGNPIINYDLDLIVIILLIATAVATIAYAVVQYIYKKNKYKDHEFKKVDPKAYLKTAIIAFLFIITVVLDLFLLITRVTVYNNAENVANPMDAMIIAFVIIAGLLAGYFLRKYYISIKETIEKNRREKLKLNQQALEDGTTTIKKDK